MVTPRGGAGVAFANCLERRGTLGSGGKVGDLAVDGLGPEVLAAALEALPDSALILDPDAEMTKQHTGQPVAGSHATLPGEGV